MREMTVPGGDAEGGSLTIGIAIRNEEQTLPSMIRSLARAVDTFARSHPDTPVEVIYCPNGCTDASEAIVDATIADGLVPARCRKVSSSPGLIRAQRAIVAARGHRGITIFIDADVLVETECINHLWDEIRGAPELRVCYARVVPDVRQRPAGLAGRLFDRYARPALRTRRRYFHGRCFAIRDWDVPDFDDPTRLTQHQRAVIADPVHRHLRLAEGPLVDDIYLSRALVHRHGAGAIRECPGTRVWYTPPYTLGDFYRRARRVHWELRRLDLLFPEHAALQEGCFRRRPDWGYIRRLPAVQKAGALLTLALESVIERAVELEYAVVRVLRCLSGDGGSIFTRCETSKRVPLAMPIPEDSHA